MIKTPTPRLLPASIDAALDLLAGATSPTVRSRPCVSLALKMGRPLFLEGRPASARPRSPGALDHPRAPAHPVACYGGLDVAAAVCEWNYAAQMIAIRVAKRKYAAGGSGDVFSGAS
jgi:hypothetical protein